MVGSSTGRWARTTTSGSIFGDHRRRTPGAAAAHRSDSRSRSGRPSVHGHASRGTTVSDRSCRRARSANIGTSMPAWLSPTSAIEPRLPLVIGHALKNVSEAHRCPCRFSVVPDVVDRGPPVRVVRGPAGGVRRDRGGAPGVVAQRGRRHHRRDEHARDEPDGDDAAPRRCRAPARCGSASRAARSSTTRSRRRRTTATTNDDRRARVVGVDEDDDHEPVPEVGPVRDAAQVHDRTEREQPSTDAAVGGLERHEQDEHAGSSSPRPA